MEFVQHVADGLGISTLVLALILTPIATELPEKANSILWIRAKKDTLAIGNITGAMVFQSSVPVALGVVFTPWDLGPTLLSAVLSRRPPESCSSSCGGTSPCGQLFPRRRRGFVRRLPIVRLSRHPLIAKTLVL